MSATRVAIISPDNSTLRFVDLHSTEKAGVVNWVAKLDEFPEKKNNDGYDDDESRLFKVKHKIVRIVNKVKQTSLIEGIYCVGKKASEMTLGESLTGIEKYMNDEYLTALMTTALLQLYPNGFDGDIQVAVTHPFDYNADTRDYIADTVGRKYEVELRDGTKRVYNVKEVHCFNETEGAIAFLSGTFRTMLDASTELVTMFDWGHRTLQKILVTVTNKKIDVSFDTARTYDIGGKHYLDLLAKHLATTHKSELRINADRVAHDRRLFNAMLRGEYHVEGNYTIDVNHVVDDIKVQASRDFASKVGGTNSEGIIWVGGSSIFFAELTTALSLNRGFTWGENSILGATPELIRYINLLGIRSMMLDNYDG